MDHPTQHTHIFQLPDHNSFRALSAKEQVDLLKQDLTRRALLGERGVLEGYLQKYPDLAELREVVMELIAQEILLRQGSGEPTPPEEYFSRFPHMEEELSRHFRARETLSLRFADPSGPNDETRTPSTKPRFPSLRYPRPPPSSSRDTRSWRSSGEAGWESSTRPSSRA